MDTIIRKILKKHQIEEPFVKLATHGIANDIYATPNYILRVPTEHPEAITDAYTESVAAPLAKLHGIKTPKMICFDDSLTLINKTYSIWERISGVTLGDMDNYLNCSSVWIDIGHEIGKLHTSVKNSFDPNGWLDHPDREYTKEMMLQGLRENVIESSYLLALVENRYTDGVFDYKKCFVHGDTNEYNFLCTEEGRLLAVIDWGDAGWADPAIDFYMIPEEAIYNVMRGYCATEGVNIDGDFLSRILLDKVWVGIEERQDIHILENGIMKLEKQLLEETNRKAL